MQPVGGFAAEMRGGEGNAAAAYQFGVVGGETAQHEAAEAVADEVQRFLVLLVVAADGFGEAAAVLGLYLGQSAARLWRRMLSESRALSRNDPGLLREACAAVEAEAARVAQGRGV